MKPSWNLEGLFLVPGRIAAEYREPFLDRRLIDFILSLPELGWTFDKYLLRTAMKGRLPGEVVQRPKQPLYGYFRALLQEEGSRWIHRWKPSPVVERYIDVQAAGKCPDLFASRDRAFVNVRMYQLETWLNNLEAVRF